MPITEVFDRLQIERIAERVRDHHCLRPRGECVFELRNIDVVLRNRHVDKHRHRAVLNDRRNSRRKSRRNRDHFVAALEPTFAEHWRCQRHERRQIRRRTGIDCRAELDSEIFRQPALEFRRIPTRRQPKFQRAVDEILHLFMIVNAPRVIDPIACAIRVFDMKLVVISLDERENFVMQFLFCHCFTPSRYSSI